MSLEQTQKLAQATASASQQSALGAEAEVEQLVTESNLNTVDQQLAQNLNETIKSVEKEKDDVYSELTTDNMVSAVDKYDSANKTTTQERNQQVNQAADFAQQERDLADLAGSNLLPSNEMYLTKNQPIQVGSYSGKYVGNVPIFAAPAALVPHNILQQRALNLSKAAKERVKVRDKIMESFQIDTKEQYQQEMNNMTSEMINYYGQKTGWKFEQLKDMSNPLAREYRNNILELKSIAKTTADFDGISEKLLVDSNQKGTYVPLRVQKIALGVRNGVINVNDLFSDPKKMEQFRNDGRKLMAYENSVSRVNEEVISKIKANKEPLLEGLIGQLTSEQRNNLKNIYETANLQGDSGKVLLFNALREYVPQNDVDENVRILMEKGNFYLGENKEEESEIIKEMQEFAWNQLGEEITVNTSIFDAYDANGNGNGNNDNAPVQVFGNIVNLMNNETVGLTAQMNKVSNKLFALNSQNEYAWNDNFDFSGLKNGVMKQLTNNSADGSSTVWKSTVQLGKRGSQEFGDGQIRIDEMKFYTADPRKNKGETLNAMEYLEELGTLYGSKESYSDLPVRVKKGISLVTGMSVETIEKKQEEDAGFNWKALSAKMDGSTLVPSVSNKTETVLMVEGVNGKMVPMSNELIIKTIKGNPQNPKQAVDALLGTVKPYTFRSVQAKKYVGEETIVGGMNLPTVETTTKKAKYRGYQVDNDMPSFVIQYDLSDQQVAPFLDADARTTVESTKASQRNNPVSTGVVVGGDNDGEQVQIRKNF